MEQARDTVDSIDAGEPRLRAYEAKYAGLWLVLSVAFMCVLLLELTSRPEERGILYAADAFLWVAFVFDFLWRHHITVDKSAFWRSKLNLLDLAVVLSFPLLMVAHVALLGFARLGRLAVIVIRLARGAALIGETASRAQSFFRRGNIRVLLALSAILVVFLTALVWRFETPHANYPIQNWYDSAWWAIVTLFTVGYGDLYPKSLEGRVAAIALMLVGITLFGWVTAALASLFVENQGNLGTAKKQADMVRNQEALREQLDLVLRRLDEIERAVTLTPGEAETVALLETSDPREP